MKEEHKYLTPTEKALITWYQPDHDLYKNPEHPILGLAGEIGEILDLYKKHIYKSGFDWMNCKWCNEHGNEHTKKYNWCFGRWVRQDEKKYTPKIIDELSDLWYYLRIVAWIYDVELYIQYSHYLDTLPIIKTLYAQSSLVLNEEYSVIPIEDYLQEIYEHLLLLLEKLGYTIDQLTELNYLKLNSEPTNHGWKQ